MNKILLIVSLLYCLCSCTLNDKKNDEVSKIDSIQKVINQYAYLEGEIFYPSEFPPLNSYRIQVLSKDTVLEYSPKIIFPTGKFKIKIPVGKYYLRCIVNNLDAKILDTAYYTNYNVNNVQSEETTKFLELSAQKQDSTYYVCLCDWDESIRNRFFNETKIR